MEVMVHICLLFWIHVTAAQLAGLGATILDFRLGVEG